MIQEKSPYQSLAPTGMMDFMTFYGLINPHRRHAYAAPIRRSHTYETTLTSEKTNTDLDQERKREC